ncbi:hypothetical protein SAMN05518683_11754 [Salibacterium halotolerans]|uniref:Uncharacterized protein n=1 Tax=Salibacterium halotolerans TaxID=1884432 RepID=A0A1I5VUK7_9BACI|nr:hypothetical protein SAMN05518683_11754 [Salibacterium halotolerans]
MLISVGKVEGVMTAASVLIIFLSTLMHFFVVFPYSFYEFPGILSSHNWRFSHVYGHPVTLPLVITHNHYLCIDAVSI